MALEQPKMQTRGHASKIDSPPHVGYDVGDYASSYLPANTGSRCGLGCILVREHVKCSLTSRLNKVNTNEHLMWSVVTEWVGGETEHMCSVGVDYPARTGHV